MCHAFVILFFRGKAPALAPRAEITIDLAQGSGQARVVTSDLTYEYIRINAEVHT